jgi:inner membrane protein
MPRSTGMMGCQDNLPEGGNVSRAVLLKTFLIALLSLILMLPVASIRELIAERQARRNEAVEGIALGWGKRQTLVGPYLLVPYERTWTEVTREAVDGSVKERRIERKESRQLRLPVDSVEWSMDVTTSEKVRGIYKARLYSARIQATGRVSIAARFGLAETAGSKLSFGVPRLVLGVADPRGLRSVSSLDMGGSATQFLAGSGDHALAAGIHAPLGGALGNEARGLAFGFSLELTGSEALAVAPLAHDTAVALRADWPHPSFQGVFLPVSHAAQDGGFRAQWRVSRYAAQGAQRLASCAGGECGALAAQEAAVSFIEPANVYQQLERAAKYGFLFIGLIFAAFFMFELLRRLMIHPVQYALVGLALAIFFLLLTALSEHMDFAGAYALASSACVGLVTAYVLRILRSAPAGLAFGGALACLYGVLYVLIQAEDYSLLGGALLLFVLLAAAMLATRKVDWYRLTEPA